MMDVFVMRSNVFSVLAVCCLASGTLTLAGCGSDEGDEAAAAAAPQPAAGGSNRAPTISGSPLNIVMQGTSYTFTPTAADADGNTLTFTVVNKPAWASFDTGTGQLSGTPAPSDIGTTTDIAISVSDGASSASLASFSIQVVATATGSAMLTWNPPTQNTDGSPLTDLAGYKVYWGTTPGSYSSSVVLSNAGLSSYVVDQLAPATWYFVLTGVNSAGVESGFSNQASKQVR
jgi:hypothetical protein